MQFVKRIPITLFLVYALLAFPLFYFVYKYSVPYFGTIDFFDYYKLYKNMDYKGADSPLNMRLFGSFFVYMLNKTGLVYNTETNIDHADFEKSIYFNAILVNYIFVILTCTMIFYLLRRKNQSLLMSFVGGMLYLLGFGTIFYELMPLADAAAIFLFTGVLWFYFKRSHLVILPLSVLVLQREYLFLALGLVALMDYLRNKDKYYVWILLYSILFFGIYVMLRKLVFETPRYSHHTSFSFIIESLKDLRFPLLPFLRQTAMTMNIFIIYLAIIAIKKIRGLKFDRYELLKIILLLLQIFVLSFLFALGNNTGRYFYILLPLVIVNLVSELDAFKLQESGITKL